MHVKRGYKVLYVVSGTGMLGGATKSFLAMLREANKAGIRYEVVCPDEEGLTRYLRSIGVTVHVCHYRRAALPPSGGIADIIKWLPRLVHDRWINHRAAKALPEMVRSFAPDLVHENSSAVNIGYRIAKSLSLPYVMHIREYGWQDFRLYMPDLKKRIADASTFVVTITKDLLRHRNLEDNPRAIQIYNGIIDALRIRYTTGKSRYFLYAGRVDRGKGIADLVDAYIIYAGKVDKPLQLLVAGASTYPEFRMELEKKVDEAGLHDMVKWLGARTDVDDLMYRAAATVVPSYNEGLGRVLPEAMANGCLCIGRYTGGTKEQIDNGLALTGGDVAMRFDTTDQLADMLCVVTKNIDSEDCFGEDGEYRRLICRSQKAVAEFFTEEGFGRRLVAFYDRILRGSDNIG